MRDIKLTMAKVGLYVSVPAVMLGLLAGMAGCSNRNGNIYKKKADAKTICPSVVRISQLEQEMEALDSSKYLLVEYESMAEKRKKIQSEYDSFMSNPANKAVYRQYTHPEEVKIPDQEARNLMKYGFGSFALGLSLLIGCMTYGIRRENQ